MGIRIRGYVAATLRPHINRIVSACVHAWEIRATDPRSRIMNSRSIRLAISHYYRVHPVLPLSAYPLRPTDFRTRESSRFCAARKPRQKRRFAMFSRGKRRKSKHRRLSSPFNSELRERGIMREINIIHTVVCTRQRRDAPSLSF